MTAADIVRAIRGRNMTLSEKGRDLIFAAGEASFAYGRAIEKNWVNHEDAAAGNAQSALIGYIAELEAKVTRLVEDGDEYAEKINELEAAHEWRPIDTAPKDGTKILTFGYIPEDYGYHGREDGYSISFWCGGWVSQAGGGFRKQFVPTHWKLLMEPPA